MEDIVNAYDSSSDSNDGESTSVNDSIDFHSLKEKFKLNSTPQILIKVSLVVLASTRWDRAIRSDWHYPSQILVA